MCAWGHNSQGHVDGQARRDSSQQHLQDRISNARLLAELVKFRILPLGTFFTLLKVVQCLPLHSSHGSLATGTEGARHDVYSMHMLVIV